jgi:hypothetical protein
MNNPEKVAKFGKHEETKQPFPLVGKFRESQNVLNFRNLQPMYSL